MVGITLEHITKRFGETIAVDDASLEIRKGELFFLLGPSGCGKTTILRMIAGFETPETGTIAFDGRSIQQVPAHRRNTGLVFQNYALWPHMTVAQNVAYGLEERRVPKTERVARVKQALATVRMEDYGERMSNQLSGGQQQRVALARALVIEPDVVLLDEPLSNLDARLRLDMRHEIKRIHAETGITMVYVTHDQKEALSMADRMAIMSMGRVEQIGAPRDMYRTPANRFVADFVGETNLFKGRLSDVRDGEGTVTTPQGIFRARVAVDTVAEGHEVLCMVRPEGLALSDAGRNTFRARMQSSMYLGECEQCELVTGDHRVRVLHTNPAGAPPETGMAVTLSFGVEDAVILELQP